MKSTRAVTNPHPTLSLSNTLTRFRAGIFLLAIAAPLVVAILVTQVNASDVFLQRFPVGFEPTGLAFDGTSIWVVNQGDNTVTKLRGIDGANQGTFQVGSVPLEATFDGANIWVTNWSSDTVTKLRASDGALQG